jgi:hypothetical protein
MNQARFLIAPLKTIRTTFMGFVNLSSYKTLIQHKDA